MSLEENTEDLKHVQRLLGARNIKAAAAAVAQLVQRAEEEEAAHDAWLEEREMAWRDAGYPTGEELPF